MKTNYLNITKVFFICLISLFYISCTSQESKQKKRQNEITEYAEKINSNPVALNQNNADTLLSLYNNYIKDFPKDTMNEFYLFQMYNVYSAMNNCDSALYCLDRIIKEYPNGKKVGAAYFFKALVLNDVCLNKEESVKAFQLYIEKFPNSKHVQTAKRMMQLDTMDNPLQIIGADK